MTNKLLIFDCDGTLVDSEVIANEVFLAEVRKLGVQMTEEEAWEHFPGTSLAICMNYVEEKYGITFDEDFIIEYRQIQVKVFAEKLQPIPGVIESLNQISGTMCVASNGPPDIVSANLKTTGLDHFFNDDIFSAYDINKWKPLPDLFLHAAQTMGYKPKQCIVIEDSEAGILGALNAGMKVLAYQGDHMHYKPAVEGAIPFQNMFELPELVKSI